MYITKTVKLIHARSDLNFYLIKYMYNMYANQLQSFWLSPWHWQVVQVPNTNFDWFVQIEQIYSSFIQL